MQIPLWFEINRSEFDELTRNIYDNQDNKDFKITINKITSDLKNAKKILKEITPCKISKNVARELFGELIQIDIDALERKKNDARKYNILDILRKMEVKFTGTYLHNKAVPKEI